MKSVKLWIEIKKTLLEVFGEYTIVDLHKEDITKIEGDWYRLFDTDFNVNKLHRRTLDGGTRRLVKVMICYQESEDRCIFVYKDNAVALDNSSIKKFRSIGNRLELRKGDNTIAMYDSSEDPNSVWGVVDLEEKRITFKTYCPVLVEIMREGSMEALVDYIRYNTRIDLDLINVWGLGDIYRAYKRKQNK